MHTRSGYSNNARIRQLQELMRGTKIRWLFNPSPINSKEPTGEWSYVIDYSDCSIEEVHAFERAWNRMETPIIESVRKRTFINRLRILFLRGWK